MIRPGVFVRSEAEVNDSVQQQETSALVRPLRVEFEHPAGAAVPITGNRRRQKHRPTEFFGSRRNVECVQAGEVDAILFYLSHQIYRVGRRVDDRGACNTHLRNQVGFAHVAGRHRCCCCSGGNAMCGIQQRYLPQGLAVGPEVAVGVERIHAVVLGGYEHHIVFGARLRSARAHRNVRHVQRLRDDVAVHNVVKQLAEIVGVHVGGSEDCLARVRARARSVVVLRGHVLRRSAARKEENRHGAQNQRQAHFSVSVLGKHAVLPVAKNSIVYRCYLAEAD